MKYTQVFRPPTIVFDIDGTLVNTSRAQYLLDGDNPDFDRYNDMSYLCPEISWVVEHAKEARRMGFRVIQLTARCSKYRDLTVRWLEEHGVPSDAVYMRKEDDYRDDYDVKKEFIQQLLKIYDIRKAFDDKPSIVNLWGEYDIPCITVFGDVGLFEGEVI